MLRKPQFKGKRVVSRIGRESHTPREPQFKGKILVSGIGSDNLVYV